MSTVQIPPGWGYYSRTYTVAGGVHEMVNSFGFSNAGGQVAAIAVGAVRTACSNTGSLYSPAMYSSDYTWVGDYCLVNNGGVLTSTASVVSIPGTLVIDTPPPGVSVVIRKVTNLAGRQFRGRIALPAGWLDETEVDSAGGIDAGAQTAIQTAANVMMSNLVAAGRTPYLLHGPNLAGVTPIPTAIQSLAVEGMVGSQRRRQRR